MTSNWSRTLVLVICVALFCVAPSLAQAPDCTGISDISDFDGDTITDMVGLLTTVRIASGLSSPLHVVAAPGDNERLFVIEQAGRIKIIFNGSVLSTPYLDIVSTVRDSGNEEGLLGLAFHPEYGTPGADNEGNFFVYYTDNSGNQTIARYSVNPANPNDALENSATTVLTISHPSFSNHNGGGLAFRPNDGHLYAGTGDGGGACDPGPGSTGNAQDRFSLLGKILRLNVDSLPYTTTGNPFDGGGGAPEVWAYGMRNPYRFAFDRETSSIYIGDVGQNAREEIDCSRPGGGAENYGWPIYEAELCPSCGNPSSACGGIAHEPPIGGYNWFGGAAVVGGQVYRGCRMGDLEGTYFYADYAAAFIRSFRSNGFCSAGAVSDRTTDLDPGPAQNINSITGFGRDNQGELYITDRGGEVFKVLPTMSIMEVSGSGAQELTLGGAGGDMSWEDLNATSGHLIANYKVYRSDNGPAGLFECVDGSTTSTWAGGDPAVPAAGEVAYYLVTAVSSLGEESRPGNQSDGTARTVDTASFCP